MSLFLAFIIVYLLAASTTIWVMLSVAFFLLGFAVSPTLRVFTCLFVSISFLFLYNSI